ETVEAEEFIALMNGNVLEAPKDVVADDATGAAVQNQEEAVPIDEAVVVEYVTVDENVAEEVNREKHYEGNDKTGEDS
ncbi:MAG: hypothetical protein U0M15_06580, partial [Bacillota bacterium]|nr:hypothetical protein [Bacillota bacterium]